MTKSGRPFFVNHETKVTQWTRPECHNAPVSMTRQLSNHFDALRPLPPSYDKHLSAGEIEHLLETHSITQIIVDTLVQNGFLTLTSIVLWCFCIDAGVKGDVSVLVFPYFVYFGFFVFFGGYFPPCFLNLLEGGPCVQQPAPHHVLRGKTERTDDVFDYLQRVPTTKATLKLHVKCSHSETRGSGKNRRTVTVDTFSACKEFQTNSVEDDSDVPEDWMSAFMSIPGNIYLLNYLYSYEMASSADKDSLEKALLDYKSENAHRDTRCNTWAEMTLGCDKKEDQLISKGFFCLPRFFLNRCTLGLFSYAGLLLIYLIIFNVMCKPVTYHCKKVFADVRLPVKD